MDNEDENSQPLFEEVAVASDSENEETSASALDVSNGQARREEEGN